MLRVHVSADTVGVCIEKPAVSVKMHICILCKLYYYYFFAVAARWGKNKISYHMIMIHDLLICLIFIYAAINVKSDDVTGVDVCALI